MGVVVIGRNEGSRLDLALDSVLSCQVPAVYVDSGSTDGSPERARSKGFPVIELDDSSPFTAARGRNAGQHELLRRHPDISLLQFLDGDCALAANWLARGTDYLQAHPNVGLVFGRRREANPRDSLYNYLCDLEWDGSPGPSTSCGGDVLVRREAFQDAGGYNPTLIAGEDPEFSFRVRRAGWTIHRLGEEMTVHDAAMKRFSQWWRRSVRTGHAYAECRSMHGSSAERFRVRETDSNWFWGLAIPAGIAVVAGMLGPAAWGALLLYPAQAIRIAVRERRTRSEGALCWGCFCVLSKFPQVLGQASFWWHRWRGRRTALVEYKGPTPNRD